MLSSHQVRFQCIYESNNLETLCSWQLGFWMCRSLLLLTQLSLLVSHTLAFPHLSVWKHLLILILPWSFPTEFWCWYQWNLLKYLTQFLLYKIIQNFLLLVSEYSWLLRPVKCYLHKYTGLLFLLWHWRMLNLTLWDIRIVMYYK